MTGGASDGGSGASQRSSRDLAQHLRWMRSRGAHGPPPRPETELSRRAKYRWAGVAGAALLRLWGRTWRVRWDLPDAVRDTERSGRILHAFWHCHILPLTYLYRDRAVVVLVSRHGDGEFISQIIHRLGFGTVRGSTSRGGVPALLEMARTGQTGFALAMSPDGPRGPRHELQPGLMLIAQRTGFPVVAYSCSARRSRFLDSWDRFEVPLPFILLYVTAEEPITIPPTADRAEVERIWMPAVAGALRRAEGRARQWAQQTSRERPAVGDRP